MFVYDLHNDYPTAISAEEYGPYLKSIDNVRVVSVIWTSEFDKSSALERVFDIYSKLVDARANLIAIEDLGFLRDDLNLFDFSKYIYCSLTWNYNNAFAGGALDDGTLTKRGIDAIERMNTARCAVDLSHLNKKSFFKVADIAKNPFCSHTGFTDHPRCLNDDMIKILITRGGIIGLTPVCKFSGASDIPTFVEVIDRFVQRYDNSSLAIGTDFYGSDDMPNGLNGYRAFYDVSLELQSRFGYSEHDVNKIFFENANNFFRRTNP